MVWLCDVMAGNLGRIVDIEECRREQGVWVFLCAGDIFLLGEMAEEKPDIWKFVRRGS